MRRLHHALLALALTLCAPGLWAQDSRQSTTLSGTVRGADGAAIRGVTVTATNRSSGSRFTAISSADGQYTVGDLQPGTYDVTAALEGFATATIKGVQLKIGARENAVVNFAFEPSGDPATRSVRGSDGSMRGRAGDAARERLCASCEDPRRTALSETRGPDMEKPDMERRALVTGLLAAAALPRTLHGAQDPEVPTYWAEVPARATLWALVVFTADEPVEVTVAAGKEIKALRGRFDGTRMAEYSWHNRSDDIARIAIRARALAGDRELPAARVQYLSEQNLYLAFGRRATPAHASDRRGGYPYEAVFVGFVIFGE